MIAYPHRDLEFVLWTMETLATPSARDAALKLKPLQKGRGGVMIDHKPLAAPNRAKKSLLVVVRPNRIRKLRRALGRVPVVQEQHVKLLERIVSEILARRLSHRHGDPIPGQKLLEICGRRLPVMPVIASDHQQLARSRILSISDWGYRHEHCNADQRSNGQVFHVRFPRSHQVIGHSSFARASRRASRRRPGFGATSIRKLRPWGTWADEARRCLVTP